MVMENCKNTDTDEKYSITLHHTISTDIVH